jgi:hypothetical protein
MIVSIAVFELKYLNLVGLISGQNGKWEIEGVILYQFSLCNLLAQKINGFVTAFWKPVLLD